MRKILAALLLAALSFTASAGSVFTARYGVEATFPFELFNADGTLDVDEVDGGTEVSVTCYDGTPASATATNDFADQGAHYSITLTATEMQCRQLAVEIGATLTSVFYIQTVNNALAEIPTLNSNLMTVEGADATDTLGTAQTGDAYARLGPPAGASTAADIAAVKVDTTAILVDTAEIGAAGAGLTAIDLPNQTMDITGTISTVTSVTNIVTADMTQVSGDSAAADALESAFDGTAGAVSPLGIARQGTAQSATGTTLVMDAGAAFAADAAIGMTVVACGSTQGYCQSRAVTDSGDATSDTLTVDTWTVTPSGTITFYLFATAPASGGGGDATAANQTTMMADLDNIQTRIPAALVGGRIDSSTGAMAADVVTAAALAPDAGTELGTATWASTTRLLTAGTNIVLAKGTGVTGFNDLSAAQVNAEADTALSDLHLQYLLATTYDPAAPPGAVDSLLEDLVENNAGVTRFTAAALAQAPTGSGESLTAIADAVWDEVLSGHAGAGSTGEALTSAAAGGGLDAAGVRAAVGLATANLDTQLADLPTVAEFNARTVTSATYATATAVQTVDDNVDAVLIDTAEIGVAGAGLTAVDDAVLAAIEQTARMDAAIVNCAVNTANFAGSTTTVACILTDRDDGAITAASGDLEGRELLILSGAQIYEGRFINDTTWDAANSELQLTLSRALPGTLADAVTAIIR